MVGDEGFEPPNAGIKIRCLDQLGESPTDLVLSAGNDPAFPPYQDGVIPLYYESLIMMIIMCMNLTDKYRNLNAADYEAIADSTWPKFETFCQHDHIPAHVYEEIDQMLNLTEFDHPSFCILPFYGIEYPEQTFCCLTPPGSDRDKVKSQIMSGQRAKECAVCWQLEDQGLRSDRLIKNQSFDFHHNQSMHDLYNQLQMNPVTDLLCAKIDSDRTCNATCMTCGAGSSTAWEQLTKTERSFSIRNTWHQQPELNYRELKSLMFRGGEPFLSKNNFVHLERLLDAGNDFCHVSFVTNGSIWPNSQQLDALLKFKNLTISFSIDGVGKVFDYLRYPLRWDTVTDNLQHWQRLGIQLGVSYTLSNLNIFYHEQTCQWFKSINLPFLINRVRSPKHFSINSLPADIKYAIARRLHSTDIKNIFQPHQKDDDEQFETFKQNILWQDQLKAISIRQYLPEFADLIRL